MRVYVNIISTRTKLHLFINSVTWKYQIYPLILRRLSFKENYPIVREKDTDIIDTTNQLKKVICLLLRVFLMWN